MNKLILCLFVALTALVIHVRWSDGSLDTFFDDFVEFTSLKAKRDLEFEEFLKDGNMFEAKKRAVHRQKRMNEENMSESLKRARRTIAEAEDEDEDEDDDIQKRCSADEYNGRKRDDCFVCSFFREPIKWYHSTEKRCSDDTKERLESVMIAEFNGKTDCTFEAIERVSAEEADIVFQCDPTLGNFAPLGHNAFAKVLNVLEPNPGPKAGIKILVHELGHICCLQHTQKLKGSSAVQTRDEHCIQSGMEDQFKEQSCTNECSSFLQYPPTWLSTVSPLQYGVTAFKNGQADCQRTIIPKRSSLGPFNARKSLWLTEIHLIQEAACLSCGDPATLQKDESYGKGCSILSLVKVYDAFPAPISSSPMCLDPELQTVTYGSVVTYECPDSMNYFIVTKLTWNDVPYHQTCKNGAFRMVVRQDSYIGELGFMCGDGDDNAISLIMDCEDVLMIDSADVGAGTMEIEITACV